MLVDTSCLWKMNGLVITKEISAWVLR